MSDLSKELSNNPDLIERVNESFATLNLHFEELKKLLYVPLTDTVFNDAFQHCYDIVSVIPLMKIELSNLQLVRGRPHYMGEPLVCEKSEVSYNWKFRDKIKLGRFNRQAEPLFYASLPTESKDMDHVLSCSLECCKELSVEYNTTDVQDITISGWIVEKPFYVLNLCFDDLHLKDNPSLKEAVVIYLKAIHSKLSTEAADFIERFLRYFSELSREIMPDNQCYQLLTPLFIAIRYYWEHTMNQPVYGLIYPSAMSLAKGLNVVLTREAVDECLKLYKVVIYRYLVEPERTSIDADKCSDIVNVIRDQFTITNYIPPSGYQTFK